MSLDVRKYIYITIFLLIFVVSFFYTSQVYAGDFGYDYNVHYRINTNGNTSVEQQVTITNNNSQLYPQNYTLNIASESIENVHAYDEVGNISALIQKTQGQTLLTLPFNSKNVGFGKKSRLTINYLSKGIAEKRGQVWELIIPGFVFNSDIKSYNVRLDVPESFGPAAYLSPPPNAQGMWTLNELKDRGITAAYGDNQSYTYNLIYHLANNTDESKIEKITIPPDTAYQKVVISRISEKPQNVIVDGDGNWIAEINLPPKSQKNITVEGNIFVYLKPRQGTQFIISDSQRKLYTRELKYWEQTPQIKTMVASFNDVFDVYTNVVKILSYDYERITPDMVRFGAEKALSLPSNSICMEYSDLFIALARAKGIPARELHGYAYTTNQRIQPLSLVSDILHSWVEYYDVNQLNWIPVDPTWEDTTFGVDYFNKLDFNHITFAILGEHSDAPLPAGAFKDKTTTKDVYIDFVKEPLSPPTPEFTTEVSITEKVISGTDIKGRIIIENVGLVSFLPEKLNIVSSLRSDLSNKITLIPPYGRLTIPLTINTFPVLKVKTEEVVIEIGDQKFHKNVVLLPFYYNAIVYVGLVFLLMPGVLIFIIKYVKHAHS